MKKALVKGLAVSTLGMLLRSTAAMAQQSVSVSGHVSAEGRPLERATVRVPVLNITRTTDRSGFYSFLIPARRVGGQTVVLTASFSDRRDRFLPDSATITLSGGAIVRDFDLRRETN